MSQLVATAPMKNRTLYEEVLEVVRELPDLSAAQVAEFCPERNPNSVGPALIKLYQRGLLERTKIENKKGGSYSKAYYIYRISANPVPHPPEKSGKRRKAIVVGEAAIEALKDRIKELEAKWAEAVKRYPDLAVDPVVLQARKLVASNLGADERHLRENFLAGRCDDKLPMRVAIQALTDAANVGE